MVQLSRWRRKDRIAGHKLMAPYAKLSRSVSDSLPKPKEPLSATFIVLLKGFRIEEKRDLLSNVPFAGVFAQEIVERRRGKAIFSTYWPFSLISENDLLIDIVTLSVSKAHFES